MDTPNASAPRNRFVVKDLLITVDGSQLAADYNTGACCLNPCSLPSCDNNSCVVTPITGGYAQEVVLPADLTALKAQLLAAVAEVERHQSRVRDELAPQNLQEVEIAETQLRSALDEVQQLKRQFEG
jgi:hypothetical protein